MIFKFEIKRPILCHPINMIEALWETNTCAIYTFYNYKPNVN